MRNEGVHEKGTWCSAQGSVAGLGAMEQQCCVALRRLGFWPLHCMAV